jgi:hypothetical protein
MNLPGTAALIVILVLGAVFMFCGKRRLRSLGSILSVGAVASLGFFIHQVIQFGRIDPKIEIGTSKQNVLALQGRPTATTDCMATYGGYTEKLPAPGCAEILWYYSFLTPEAWEYVFDSGGRLVHKYHWQSP